MRDLFIGSEALAAGRLTRAELRRRYTRLLPDVYGPKAISPTMRVFTTAAWLWSHRRGVIAGQAAASLHLAIARGVGDGCGVAGHNPDAHCL